jgi:hypothetical protein
MPTQVDFMEIGKALEIVFNMAKRLYLEYGENLFEVQLALDTVEDFIVNNFDRSENLENFENPENLKEN